MSSTTNEYRGYRATVKYSAEDSVLFGKIAGIRDLVTFESDDAAGVEAAFQEAVDDYIADCEADGREPEKPFSGSFNVRVDQDVHRQLHWLAVGRELKLNAVVSRILTEAVQSSESSIHTLLSRQSGTAAKVVAKAARKTGKPAVRKTAARKAATKRSAPKERA